MLFSRQTDASDEIAQGLALGINTLGGGRKSIYIRVYCMGECGTGIDRVESGGYEQKAKRL